MKIEVNVEKKHLYLFTTILVFMISIGFVFGNWDTTKKIFHNAADVKISYEGVDQDLQTVIDDLAQRVTDNEGALSPEVGATSCNLFYDSYSSEGISFIHPVYEYTVLDVPASCSSETGCVIKEEVYDSGGLRLVRQYNYIQYESASDKENWWSSYQTSGILKNGDTLTHNIIPAYGNLFLWDDYYVAGKTEDRQKNKWTLIDLHTLLGMKIYVCSIA